MNWFEKQKLLEQAFGKKKVAEMRKHGVYSRNLVKESRYYFKQNAALNEIFATMDGCFFEDKKQAVKYAKKLAGKINAFSAEVFKITKEGGIGAETNYLDYKAAFNNYAKPKPSKSNGRKRITKDSE